jgi:hypothetical protein
MTDSAAGMSPTDADTLVRHKLPAVIVAGRPSTAPSPPTRLTGVNVIMNSHPEVTYPRSGFGV